MALSGTATDRKTLQPQHNKKDTNAPKPKPGIEHLSTPPATRRRRSRARPKRHETRGSLSGGVRCDTRA